MVSFSLLAQSKVLYIRLSVKLIYIYMCCCCLFSTPYISEYFYSMLLAFFKNVITTSRGIRLKDTKRVSACFY